MIEISQYFIYRLINVLSVKNNYILSNKIYFNQVNYNKKMH